MTSIAGGLPALADAARLEQLLAQPKAWVFKHSATCSISHAAEAEVAAWMASHPDAPGGALIVQTERPLSGLVALRLGYTHQSPQLFLVGGGQVRWQASHWSITGDAMDAAWNAP
jgi:thioredoxin 1